MWKKLKIFNWLPVILFPTLTGCGTGHLTLQEMAIIQTGESVDDMRRKALFASLYDLREFQRFIIADDKEQRETVRLRFSKTYAPLMVAENTAAPGYEEILLALQQAELGMALLQSGNTVMEQEKGHCLFEDGLFSLAEALRPRADIGAGFSNGVAVENSKRLKVLFLRNVRRDGPADKAGLKEWDRIVSFNGQSAPADAMDLLLMFEDMAPESVVPVVILRYGVQQTFLVTLGRKTQAFK